MRNVFYTGSIYDLGCSVKLPDTKLEKSVGALSCPTHPLTLETTADRQIDVFFHRT